MATYVETKIITLSSNSATNKKNGSFLSSVDFDLPTAVKDDKDIIHRQISLQSAQIPYSFYVVNYTCNLLKINTTTFTIPVGNYSATTLLNTIITIITPTFPNMTISINKNNGILTFSNNAFFTIFNNFQYSIGTILGMTQNTILESVGDTITLPFALNLLGIKVLEVRSFTLNMANISSLVGGQNNLLASIPVSAVPFGMIDYNNKGNNEMSFTNANLDGLDIEIVDGETGEYINFNNQGWTMTFIIHLTRYTTIKEITRFPIGVNLANDGGDNAPLPTPQNKPQEVPNKDLEELNLLQE